MNKFKVGETYKSRDGARQYEVIAIREELGDYPIVAIGKMLKPGTESYVATLTMEGKHCQGDNSLVDMMPNPTIIKRYVKLLKDINGVYHTHIFSTPDAHSTYSGEWLETKEVTFEVQE